MPKMLLLFSHQLTKQQKQDAQNNLGVDKFVPLPEKLQERFSQIPPDLVSLQEYLAPLFSWLKEQKQDGDFVLIQGDFGATFLLIQHVFQLNCRPVYATTKRTSETITQEDGSVLTKRIFQHVHFRMYENAEA